MLKDVSFKVGAGEVLGIVGRSGAGKSSLVNLISRLYDAGEGEVLVDGINVKRYGFKELRKNVAMVSQETYIFAGTVAENIAYARPDATREEIINAAVRASAHDFICKMPQGYDTLIGASRRSLSGGEKQRISIARAILADPKILILDEPTAGLDPQGRDDILDQIAALHEMRGITIILVSHSMEDIAKYVERLIVMNHGEMVFDDTPKNVFSHYKELEEMGLAAPQITYIMHALSENGLDVDPTATTVEEAKETILAALKKQKPSLLKKGGSEA